MKKSCGLVGLSALIGIVVIAVMLPLVNKLTEKPQDTRNRAMETDLAPPSGTVCTDSLSGKKVGGGDRYCTGGKNWKQCGGALQGTCAGVLKCENGACTGGDPKITCNDKDGTSVSEGQAYCTGKTTWKICKKDTTYSCETGKICKYGATGAGAECINGATSCKDAVSGKDISGDGGTGCRTDDSSATCTNGAWGKYISCNGKKCENGKCNICGKLDEDCCVGSNKCDTGLECDTDFSGSGLCKKPKTKPDCGKENQLCCTEGNACVPGLNLKCSSIKIGASYVSKCIKNTETVPGPCGDKNQSCCTTSGSECKTGFMCFSGKCICGEYDSPCCPSGAGDKCQSGLECISGYCSSTASDCGGAGQNCCTEGGGRSVCDPGLGCNSGKCQTMKDCERYSDNYGCKWVKYKIFGNDCKTALPITKPVDTRIYTLDCKGPLRNKAGGGNDEFCYDKTKGCCGELGEYCCSGKTCNAGLACDVSVALSLQRCKTKPTDPPVKPPIEPPVESDCGGYDGKCRDSETLAWVNACSKYCSGTGQYKICGDTSEKKYSCDAGFTCGASGVAGVCGKPSSPGTCYDVKEKKNVSKGAYCDTFFSWKVCGDTTNKQTKCIGEASCQSGKCMCANESTGSLVSVGEKYCFAKKLVGLCGKKDGVPELTRTCVTDSVCRDGECGCVDKGSHAFVRSGIGARYCSTATTIRICGQDGPGLIDAITLCCPLGNCINGGCDGDIWSMPTMDAEGGLTCGIDDEPEITPGTTPGITPGITPGVTSKPKTPATCVKNKGSYSGSGPDVVGGDYDCNGVTNIGDYSVWRKEFVDRQKWKSSSSWWTDIDGDGTVNNDSGYSRWRNALLN